jgi:hypothetical protein
MVMTGEGEPGAELGRIEHDSGPLEANGSAIDPETVAGKPGIEHRERPPQRSTGALLIEIGPEQRAELRARGGRLGHRDERKQGDRLASVDPNWAAIQGDPWRPEQVDRDPRRVGSGWR